MYLRSSVICLQYNKEFTDSDEIDLDTMTIVVDRGGFSLFKFFYWLD